MKLPRVWYFAFVYCNLLHQSIMNSKPCNMNIPVTEVEKQLNHSCNIIAPRRFNNIKITSFIFDNIQL
jgi:hypothetical protein